MFFRLHNEKRAGRRMVSLKSTKWKITDTFSEDFGMMKGQHMAGRPSYGMRLWGRGWMWSGWLRSLRRKSPPPPAVLLRRETDPLMEPMLRSLEVGGVVERVQST